MRHFYYLPCKEFQRQQKWHVTSANLALVTFPALGAGYSFISVFSLAHCSKRGCCDSLLTATFPVHFAGYKICLSSDWLMRMEPSLWLVNGDLLHFTFPALYHKVTGLVLWICFCDRRKNLPLPLVLNLRLFTICFLFSTFSIVGLRERDVE